MSRLYVKLWYWTMIRFCGLLVNLYPIMPKGVIFWTERTLNRIEYAVNHQILRNKLGIK